MKPKIKALINQVNSGQLTSDLSRILHHIKLHPYTTLPEVKRKLSISHQTASARISDLLDLGVIEEKGSKKTAKSSHTYFKYQPDISIQIINSKKRKKEKYNYWVKKGLIQFKEFMNPELREKLLSN